MSEEVKRLNAGEFFAATAKEHGLSEQTLRNRVKAAKAGKLNGAGSKVVTPEGMEVIGWSLKPRMTTELVADAQTMAYMLTQISYRFGQLNSTYKYLRPERARELSSARLLGAVEL